MAIKILGDIVSVVSEHISNPSKSGYHIFVGLEHYDSGEPVITRHGSTEQLESSVKHFIEGDILVARRNVYLKRAGVVNFEGVTSGDSIVLRVKEEKYKDIIPFILNTDDFWDYAEQNSDGTMSKRLAPDVLLEYECNIPENHQSIADKLWAAYKLKVSYKQMITATDEMVKSQFIEMFGSIAENSKHLPQKKLGEVATLLNGRAYKANELLSQGKYIVLRVGNFFTNADYYYSDMELDPDKYCDTGDFLYSWSATLGAQIWSGEKVIYHYHIWKVVFDEAVLNKKYFCYMLNYMTDALKQETHGSTMVHLTKEGMEKKLIVVPSLEDQNKFSNILEQADKSKFELRKSIEAIDAVIKSLING